MQRLVAVVMILASSLSFAGSAGAANLAFEGGLAIQVAALPPIALTGNGSALINGSGGGGHLTGVQLPGGTFATNGLEVALTDPAVFPINGLQLTVVNGAANFAGSGGAGFGGVMPLLGVAKVCLYGACGSSNNIANLSVPLTVIGQGGVGTAMGAVNLSVVGAPWTTATAAVGTITVMGGVSPLSNTGAPSGSMSLVTPFVIYTSIGASSVVPSFAFLTLHFVPEPGTLLLVGSGVVGLVALGRRNRR